jgi:hypothetical protein
LGAASSDDRIDGALVVWLAKAPETGRTLIVGWYENATVYRRARDGGIRINNEDLYYSVEARSADARLLVPVARTFEVPSSRRKPGEGFGQKPTWYGAEATNARVWAYIRSKRSPARQKPPGKAPPKNPDPELRRKVERAAVEHAIAYYKAEFGNACPIHSVETAAKGWDLEVYHDAKPLLVEVKGLLNHGLVCELTPNEYEKMRQKVNRDRYVIYVVNNALAKSPAVPVASVFKHAGNLKWQTDDGRELIVTEKTGAVLSCA